MSKLTTKDQQRISEIERKIQEHKNQISLLESREEEQNNRDRLQKKIKSAYEFIRELNKDIEQIKADAK
jgi:hypothetical protein